MCIVVDSVIKTNSIVYSNSIKGEKKYNQDIYGINRDIVWVIDGATNLFESRYTEDDVYFAMSTLNECLMDIEHDFRSLAEFLTAGIINAESRIRAIYPSFFDGEAYVLPTFALCIARINDLNIEYIVLGDCFLEIQQGFDLLRISDERFKEFSDRNKISIAKLDKECSSYKDSVVDIYRKTRMKLNTPNGYWIGSFDLAGINHSIMGEISVFRPALIALYTDGVLDGLRGKYLLDISCGGGKFLKNVDFECKFSNLKTRDDKTVIVLRLE